MTKRYAKHEIQRLSKRKYGKRDIGAVGRHFTLDTRDRFIMLLVYYRLYITYTLAGFLFDLDQSNICRDIQKIESLIRKCVPIPQKIYPLTKKRLQTPKEVEIFSRISCFYRLYYRTTDTKTCWQYEEEDFPFRQEEKAYYRKDTAYLWLTATVSSSIN